MIAVWLSNCNVIYPPSYIEHGIRNTAEDLLISTDIQCYWTVIKGQKESWKAPLPTHCAVHNQANSSKKRPFNVLMLVSCCWEKMVTQHNTDHNIVKVNTLDSGTLPGLDAAESLNPHAQPSFSDESGTAHSTHCIMYTGSNREDYM